MIKTEEIPHLENSTFSTRVVKDIAQNILSFLKSNCTKEGHTYWLFKGGSEVNVFTLNKSVPCVGLRIISLCFFFSYHLLTL